MLSAIRCIIVTAALAMLPGMAGADPTPLDKPIQAHVSIRNPGKPPQIVNGTATAWDADVVVIKTAAEEHTYRWTDLTADTAYRLRSFLVNKKDAHAWLDLGTMAWGMNDTIDARPALAQAVKLDPSLKDDADAVLASSAGVLLDPPRELLHDIPPDEQPPDPAKVDLNAPTPKYQKVTPGQAKAAMAAARADAKKVSDAMQIDLKEVETQHFLIFTDWDAGGCEFLKTNLEAAYAVVSKQFDIPVSENIFVGKLAVFMFNRHSDFLKFGQTFDHLPKNRSDIAGYYHARGVLLAHLVMSKPNVSRENLTPQQIQIEWAYVLTHEFTHAFVARYRSPRLIPTWLNEGIAEVIASTEFPMDVKPLALAYAKSHDSVQELFDDNAGIQPAAMYPVMRTLTEVLLLRDRQKFLKMFDELKAGATGARALEDAYGWTFDNLERAWRQYLGAPTGND